MVNLIGAAYKWRINNNVYSYITSADGDDPFISSGSTVCNEELIRNKVQYFTEDEYKTKFQEMVTIVHEKYPYVQFLDYTIYMNEVEHCDIYNRPDVVTDIDIAVCSTTLPSDSGATVEITSTDEDIECRDGEKIRKYRIDFGIPKGSSLIPIDVTDEEILNNGDQIIKDYGILAGDSVISVDSTTIWRCDENNNFINTGVKLNKSAYRYFKDINAYSFGERDTITPKGVNSITEGYATVAGYEGNSNEIEYIGEDIPGHYSHAEGNATAAAGSASHTEGKKTYARGIASHAEGINTKAYGNYSHAEGNASEAHGEGSHAEGCGNFAYTPYSTVIGKYAEIDGAAEKIFQVGWGEDEEHRRDFFAVNNDGTFIFSNSGETKTLSLSDFETVKFQSSISETDPKYNYKNGDLIFDEKDLYLLKLIEEDEDKKEDGLYLPISKDGDNLTFEAINLTKNDEIEELNDEIADLNGDITGLNEDITDLYEQIDNVTATPQFMVGTVVMWPLSDAPSGWLPCDGMTPIPNDNGEGEELIKILYPDYKEGDGNEYRTPNYRDLYTKNDIYSELFLNFIIYAGANVNRCGDESITGVTYNVGKKYSQEPDTYPPKAQTGGEITSDLLGSSGGYFAIWLWEGQPLKWSKNDDNLKTHKLTFSLNSDEIDTMKGDRGRGLYCGFIPNSAFTSDNDFNYMWGDDYAVRIYIDNKELDRLVDKDLTMTVETYYKSTPNPAYYFNITRFVKQICN